MAWDSPEARKDPNLSISAYYIRLNALHDLLSPFSKGLLESSWDAVGSDAMKGVRRSALIGKLMADLIRALDLRELTECKPDAGGWFIHSGVTYYSDNSEDPRKATIRLSDDQEITALVRRDCEITGTAGANMREADDVSLVVGRMLSGAKFDLIAAGYRRPPGLMAKNPSRTIRLENTSENVLDEIEYHPRSREYAIKYAGWSDSETLTAVVVDTFDRFKIAIEYQGAWRHLYDSNMKPAHESRHQMLFRMFANMAFEILDIQVHPGADHGTGPTDLTLTLRDAIHVVEFKKDHDRQKIVHGLTVQLPSYMRSAKTRFGAYIVMCHEQDPQEVDKLLTDSMRSMSGGSKIFVDVVDCRPQKSASKMPFPRAEGLST